MTNLEMPLKEKVADLVQLVLTGRLIEAFDKYYADDVVMQENRNEPMVGKAANRLRELAFVDSVAEFHQAEVPYTLVDGDRAVIAWMLEFTNKAGQLVRYDQVAIQKWENGQIVHERFMYDTGSH
jgi:ketosteroid isomerase-like protein